jgi:hypothetical protein
MLAVVVERNDYVLSGQLGDQRVVCASDQRDENSLLGQMAQCVLGRGAPGRTREKGALKTATRSVELWDTDAHSKFLSSERLQSAERVNVA